MCIYPFYRIGLLIQIEIDDRFDGKGVHPYSDGVVPEPWTFRVGSVNSLGWSFGDFTKMIKI